MSGALVRLLVGLSAAAGAGAVRDVAALAAQLDLAAGVGAAGLEEDGTRAGDAAREVSGRCSSYLTSWEAVAGARRSAPEAFECYTPDGEGSIAGKMLDLLKSHLTQLGLYDREIMNTVDPQKTGKLTRRKFQRVLEETAHCYHQLTDWQTFHSARQWPGYSFTCYDKAPAGEVGGGDGHIGGDELALLASHLWSLGLPAEQYISQVDANEDGELNFDEFKKLLGLCGRCGKKLTTKEAVKVAVAFPGTAFACYDLMEDGAVSRGDMVRLTADLAQLGLQDRIPVSNRGQRGDMMAFDGFRKLVKACDDALNF